LAETPAPGAIRFTWRPIDFQLDSCETPQKHAPETMAGGVAVFDANNDGYPDIFFTNGADIVSLKKTAPRYSNRLFLNDGHGHFTDATEKAGLAGTGYDIGVAIGDYDNDGYQDIFVGGVHRNTLYHNNGDGTFTDVTEKAGLAGKLRGLGRPALVRGRRLGRFEQRRVTRLSRGELLALGCCHRAGLQLQRDARVLPSEVLQTIAQSSLSEPRQRKVSGYLARVGNRRAPRKRDGDWRGGFRSRRPHGPVHRLRQGI
jgi:hypothetical protein